MTHRTLMIIVAAAHAALEAVKAVLTSKKGR